MTAIYHLVFELIKISILSCVYALLTLIIFKSIARYRPKGWFDGVSRKKLRLWFFSWVCISIALFCFMFSYYGNHGFGDDARVPIGHWRAIQEVDSRQAYIQDEGPVGMIEIDKFVVTDNYVYGMASDENENYKGKYFVYDLIENKVKTFIQEKDFTDYLVKNNLDTKPTYKDFNYYYNRYWTDLKFWLLP
jgi:hypothetical protein